MNISKTRLFVWLGGTLLLSLFSILLPLVLFIPILGQTLGLLLLLPYLLEEKLLGTAYLWNIGVTPLLISGAMLLPILGRRKRQMLLLFGVAYVCIPVSLLGAGKMSQILSLPTESMSPRPHLLTANLPLSSQSLPKFLRWSPSGKYLAISERANRQEIEPQVLIVNAETGVVLASLPIQEQFQWSGDDRLWIQHEDGWNIYAPPFQSPQSMPAKVPCEQDQCEHAVFYPDTQLFIRAMNDEYEPEWTIQVWKQGKHIYDTTVVPQHERIHRWIHLSLSPDGRYLALKFTGWIGREQMGAEELWILAVDTQELRFLHAGKTKSWQVWDYDVQELTPAWASDSQSIVFGDAEFGIERIDIQSKHRHTIFPPGIYYHTSGLHVSPTSKWLGFRQYAERGYTELLMLLSSDGKNAIAPAQVSQDEEISVWAWHPHHDRIAWVASTREKLPSNNSKNDCGCGFTYTHALYYWELDNS